MARARHGLELRRIHDLRRRDSQLSPEITFVQRGNVWVGIVVGFRVAQFAPALVERPGEVERGAIDGVCPAFGVFGPCCAGGRGGYNGGVWIEVLSCIAGHRQASGLSVRVRACDRAVPFEMIIVLHPSCGICAFRKGRLVLRWCKRLSS